MKNAPYQQLADESFEDKLDIHNLLKENTSNLTGGFYAPTVAFKGLFIGVAGNVVLTGADGVAVTMSLDTGVFPFGGIKITETGTTATSIVALS